MRLASVRVRLTTLVGLVAGVVLVLVATVGVDRIERRLEDDVLDEAVDQLVLEGVTEVEPLVLTDEEFAVPGFEEFFADDLAFFLGELAELGEELELVGAVDPLLAAMGRTRDEGLLTLTGLGRVAVIGLDDAPSVFLDDDPDDLETPVAWEINLQDVAFTGVDAELARLFTEAGDDGFLTEEGFDELFERARTERAAGVEVVTTTEVLDGIEFVVAADVADVRRSADALRGVVWVATPLLVVAAGLATWLLTGRALRPVSHMIERVERIEAGRLHERVPVAATGDEIEELGHTMNGMLARLEDDDRRLRRFVSDASHELRSPVAVLRSEAEVALRAPDATTTDRLAEGVLAESLRLQGLVDDLLVLARSDEGRAGAAPVDVDLDDVVLAEAGRRSEPAVDTRSVSAGRVRGTPEGCSRIVTHLFDNATRHARAQVAVGLRTEGGHVLLWVDDDGPGVPLDDRTRVFERFTRLDAARSRDAGGAGLGLAVVAETVAGMGGSVEVVDSPLGGARFVVRLPAVQI